MNIISLINEKGGVGKTTLANTLAAGLAIRDNRVLIIDADPQGNSTAANRAQQIDALYRVIAQDAEWADHILEIPEDVWAGDYPTAGALYLLPSHINNRLLPMAVDDPDLLLERLGELETFVDVVIIDTSPTPSMLHTMIYRASSHIIVPTQFELWSMQGMVATLSRIKKEADVRPSLNLPPLTFLGIQPNLYEHTNAHRYGLDQTRERFGNRVAEPIIKRTIWRDAAWSVRGIFAHAPGDVAESEAWAFVDRTMKGITANV